MPTVILKSFLKKEHPPHIKRFSASLEAHAFCFQGACQPVRGGHLTRSGVGFGQVATSSFQAGTVTLPVPGDPESSAEIGADAAKELWKG